MREFYNNQKERLTKVITNFVHYLKHLFSLRKKKKKPLSTQIIIQIPKWPLKLRQMTRAGQSSKRTSRMKEWGIQKEKAETASQTYHKDSNSPKLIYAFSIILIKIPRRFFMELKKPNKENKLYFLKYITMRKCLPHI